MSAFEKFAYLFFFLGLDDFFGGCLEFGPAAVRSFEGGDGDGDDELWALNLNVDDDIMALLDVDGDDATSAIRLPSANNDGTWPKADA